MGTRYEIEFSGECPACQADMEGFIRDVPRAERVVVFLCADCGNRVTAWVPAAEDLRGVKLWCNTQAVVAPSPPSRCAVCGTAAAATAAGSRSALKEWQTLRIDWKRAGRRENDMVLTAPCWECGKPVRISWQVKRQRFLGMNQRGMSFFMWCLVGGAIILSPLLLLLSPLLAIGWLLWHWLTGKCLRCGHMYTSYESMPLVSEDGGGSLRRCPRCGAHYYLPGMGPVAVQPVSAEELRRRGL